MYRRLWILRVSEYLYEMVGAKDAKNKKRVCVTFLSDIKETKKRKATKKVMGIIKKVISEQANKKTLKSHEKVFM